VVAVIRRLYGGGRHGDGDVRDNDVRRRVTCYTVEKGREGSSTL